jgi:hypothetical protein
MSTDSARSRGRRLSISHGLLVCALLAGAAELSAQAGHGATPQEPTPITGAGHRVVSGGTMYPGMVTVVSRFGPVGSTMKVAAAQLPENRDVQIMMGALRDGFEIVRTARTDDSGRIGGQDTVTVTVPDWVRPDRAYLVMITDLDYHPLAAADMFHATTPEGLITRRGVVKLENPGCPVLVADGSDEWYVLLGNTQRLIAGEEMAVRGTVVPPGECGQMTTIVVQETRNPPLGLWRK